jgi:transcription elongation GreA/GreB family factor
VKTETEVDDDDGNAMSKAFTNDDEQQEERLPDIEISPYPNYVTKTGMAQIEANLANLHKRHTAAMEAGERDLAAHIGRELRYWIQRRASAELLPPPADKSAVHFGSTVTIARADGREVKYTIVGEDEADPAHGTLSYVAPLAKALMGKSVGDRITVAGHESEILAIS